MLRFFSLVVLAVLCLWGCQNTNNDTSEVIRVATYNAYLNRSEQGELIKNLATPDNLQARKVAEIIQRTAPDVLLLSEFDYDDQGVALTSFQRNYLQVSQNDAEPIIYPYVYAGPVNTGDPSGIDLDGDGVVATTPGSRSYGGDAFGFGLFKGQYGMVVLSKFPIDIENVRSFRKFKWADMPGAYLPDNPATATPNDWYSDDARAVFRLSSKSHWDVPITVDGETIHILASHPTPPTFDGDEDRNGKRNHDELRLWADYISPGKAEYLYDDDGIYGGIGVDARFVILGDLNADPVDGDSMPGAISQLLNHGSIASIEPMSEGGVEQSQRQGGANITHAGLAAYDTSDFYDQDEGPGNLRLDYVLPSKAGFDVADAGVFWPAQSDLSFELVGDGETVISSDHRLVWVDLVIEPLAAQN